jgi:hypothetical protein
MILVASGGAMLVVASVAWVWMALAARRAPGRTFQVRDSRGGPRHDVTFAVWQRRYLPQVLGWSAALVVVGLLTLRGR